MHSISRSIRLEPRNEHFHFHATEQRDWHSGDAGKSIIFNALSILFPAGEKFFMDSVKAVRNDIDDAVLLNQIKGFLVQEALHTREHVNYNSALDAQGYSASKLHTKLRMRLNWVKSRFSAHRQLAITCALEHFTAMMADLIMKDPVFLDGADAEFKKVWLWHALEEAEHKGVAYDAYISVTGGKGYFLRIRAMLITTVIFNLFIFGNIATLLKDRGLSRSPKAWLGILNYLVGKPGFFRRMFPSWLAYFKPGYHPWNHDNRGRIAKTEKALLGDNSIHAALYKASAVV